jgi:hypothetical protein
MDLQYTIRNGKLNAITHMRSNDALWGFCYDTWLFQFLQESMASMLSVGLGNYYHFAGSMHYYEQRHKKIQSILNNDEETWNYGDPIPLRRYSGRWRNWHQQVKMLHNAVGSLSQYKSAWDNYKSFKPDNAFIEYGAAVFAYTARKVKDSDFIEELLKDVKPGSDVALWILRWCADIL